MCKHGLIWFHNYHIFPHGFQSKVRPENEIRSFWQGSEGQVSVKRYIVVACCCKKSSTTSRSSKSKKVYCRCYCSWFFGLFIPKKLKHITVLVFLLPKVHWYIQMLYYVVLHFCCFQVYCYCTNFLVVHRFSCPTSHVLLWLFKSAQSLQHKNPHCSSLIGCVTRTCTFNIV